MTQPELNLDLQPPAPKKSRPRDLIFEAMAKGCGLDMSQLTQSARGSINRAVKEIREVHPSVTAEDIIRAVAKYQTAHPTWTLSAAAIAKHWPELFSKVATKLPPNVREALAKTGT